MVVVRTCQLASRVGERWDEAGDGWSFENSVKKCRYIRREGTWQKYANPLHSK